MVLSESGIRILLYTMSRFTFLWGGNFENSYEDFERRVNVSRPKAVVFGAGPWFLWKGVRDFQGFELGLNKTIDILERLSLKVKLRNTKQH